MTSRLVLWFVCVLPCFHGHPPLYGYSTAYTPFKLHTASLLVWWPCRRDESVGFVLRFTSLTLVFWPACANRSAKAPTRMSQGRVSSAEDTLRAKHSDHGCTDWVLLWSKLLKSWKQVHWGWHILHNALRMAITVHVDYRLCFVTGFASLDHCMYCTGCDTDSLNRCQREALRYMHCTHTIAHSTVLSSALTAWLKVTV